MNQAEFDMQGGGAAAAGMSGLIMVVYLAILVLMIASMWKVFAKAGKPGWAAIVPIYNIVVLLEIIGRPIWWIALYFVPFVNFVIMLIMMVDLAKVFGKSIGFAVGLIFLPFVFMPLMAFDSSTYQGPSGGAPTGIAPAL